MSSLYQAALARVVAHWAALDCAAREGLPAAIANDVARMLLERNEQCQLPRFVTRLALPGAPNVVGQLAQLAHLEELLVRGNDALTSATVAHLQLASLVLLDVAGCAMLRDGAFEHVAERLPSLQVLCIAGCTRLGDATLLNAMRCPNLRVLDAGCVPFTNAGFVAAVRGARCARSLVRCSVTQSNKLRDDAIEALATVFGASILALEVTKCFALTDASLQALGRHCEVLQSLDVSGCCRMTGAGLARMPPTLAEFQADFCDSLDSVTMLSEAPVELRGLQVSFCRAFTPDALVECSTRFSFLSRLRLQNSSPDLLVTDAFLAGLAKSCGAHLEELQLHPCSVGDAGVAALALAAPRLQLLHLAGARLAIGRTALALLAEHCPRVRSISLGKLVGDATDDSVVQLARRLPLELLDLNYHALSPNGLLEAARHFASLKALSLRHCGQLTDEAITGLVRHASCLQSLDVSKCGQLSVQAVEAACRASKLTFVNVCGLGIAKRDLVALRQTHPAITIMD